MRTLRRILAGNGLTILPALLLALLPVPAGSGAGTPWLSPAALVATRDGQTLFVACATGNRVIRFDTASGTVTASHAMPAPPSGLALSHDDTRLFVTCGAPASTVCVVDPSSGQIVATLPAGHTAVAPAPSPDGRTLYVCNRFNDDVSFLDVAAGRETRRVKVRREPVAAALTPDGRFLLVANFLHDGRADADAVAAVVSVIDTTTGSVARELRLPNGSGGLNDLRISPDGRYAVVTHVLARFHLPTTQLERGWMNTNALTLIDVERMAIVNTVLLDSVDCGAANPWGIAWSADSRTVVVTHAGTHEVSVIDFAALAARLGALADGARDPASARAAAAVPNDLAFLVDLRRRLPLPEGDRGPRAVAIVGARAYVAGYFSDTLAVVDLTALHPVWQSIPLGPKPEPTAERQGEIHFHDASLCFQGWQSCATCHPGDARVDALNWDLLNDGLGNPKNNKSLLLTHRTPPSMSLGVRESPEEAVRAGIRHILFTVQPEPVAQAMDAYLKSLGPVPSPFLVNGARSESAKRGEAVFARASCASCHPPGLFTDLQSYDVGTSGELDRAQRVFDTPTLVELWRTAPYLHDGSAASVRDVFTSRNLRDEHGKTTGLSAQELEDLVAFVLAL